LPESTYHQIHFAWAEPTLLGRVGPGPASSSLPESEQPVLRSWRDRLVPALTADYRSALPDADPADYPETLWAHAYPDGQAALVYRWPGDVRSAHAWAIVGPGYGLTLPRILALHENPNTRPAQRRPPAPGWAAMDTLPTPEPWERTAAPGAVRTRDRHAAETVVDREPLLVGAVAAALARPDLPVHIALAPERADLWQAVQLRFLWGMHRALHDVLTPPRAIPAAGWSWSFSTYDPVLGTADGQHLAFGPPPAEGSPPFLNPPPSEHRRTAEGLVAVLRDEGGDALAAHLAERGIPAAPTFADRRDLLSDWLDPRPRAASAGTVLETGVDTALETGGGPGAERNSGLDNDPWTPGTGIDPWPPAFPGTDTDPWPPAFPGTGAEPPAAEASGVGEAAVAHGEPEPGSARTGGVRDEAADADGTGRRLGKGAFDDTAFDPDFDVEDVPEAEALPDADTGHGSGPARGADPNPDDRRSRALAFGTDEQDLPDLPEAEAPGEEETGPRPPSDPRPPRGRPGAVPPPPAARLGQGSLRGFAEEISRASDTGLGDGRARPSAEGTDRGPDSGTDRGADTASAHESGGATPPGRSNEALWPVTGSEPQPLPEEPEPEGRGGGATDAPSVSRRPRIAPAHEEPESPDTLWQGEEGPEPPDGSTRGPSIFDAPEPHVQRDLQGLLDPPEWHAFHGADEIVTDDPTPVAGRPRMFGRTLRRAADRDARAARRRLAAEPATAPEPVEEPEAPDAPEAEARETHEWTIAASPADRRDPPADGLPDTFSAPVPAPAPETRVPADAPPLWGAPADEEEHGTDGEEPLDYAAETEPDHDDPYDEGASDDHWPTQYADLPLARLERWHSRRGPEGARVDVVDARAAVRAERGELRRVREERDHYHAEVQDLRRDVARLDRPWLDSEDEEDDDAFGAPRPRRWPSRVLVLVLLVACLATGLEAGARFDLGTLELLALLGDRIASLF